MKKKDNSARNFIIFLISLLIYLEVPYVKEFINSTLLDLKIWFIVLFAFALITKIKLVWAKRKIKSKEKGLAFEYGLRLKYESKFHRYQKKANRYINKLSAVYVTVRRQGRIIKQGRADIEQMILNNHNLRAEALRANKNVSHLIERENCYRSFMKKLDELGKEEMNRDLERHYRTLETQLINTLKLHTLEKVSES